jgi:acetylornithine deacetylase
MKPVLDTLSSLVSINSINPEWGGPGEAAMADFVETFFAESGLEVIRDEVLPGRCNVMVCLPGQDRSRSVVLESHMDTVSADGMTINPLEPRIEEGLLYGRGSCDTKAGLAGMMHAVRWFVETGSTPPCDVYLAAVVDEEHIFRGVLGALEWFKKKGVQPEAAVVSEPTELRLVRANKGVLRWKIETKGVSAHSSKPHLGKNAITKMAEVILKIEKHHESLRKQEHSLLGNSTCSIGVIEGGEQINFVPSSCTISLDRRLLPGELADEVLQDYRELLSDFGDEVVVHPADLADEAMETPQSETVVETGIAVLREMEREADPSGVPFGCDVTKFSRAGIPGIIFGPGSIDQAHGAVEYVDVNEVELAFDFYRRFLLNYGA